MAATPEANSNAKSPNGLELDTRSLVQHGVSSARRRADLGPKSRSHRSLSPSGRNLPTGSNHSNTTTNWDTQSVTTAQSLRSKKSTTSRSRWMKWGQSPPSSSAASSAAAAASSSSSTKQQPSDLLNQTIDNSDSNPRGGEKGVSDRPGLEKALSTQSSLAAAAEAVPSPANAANVSTTERLRGLFLMYHYTPVAPNFPTLKDYREALLEFLADISHTFLSLLALVDILLRPLILLIWFGMQFLVVQARSYALSCWKGRRGGGIKSKAGSDTTIKMDTKTKPSRGLKRSSSARKNNATKREIGEMIG
jgi:hypothetical protein